MGSGRKIPWWVIIVCFFSGALAPIGVVLLIIKIFGEMFSSNKRSGYDNQSRGHTYQPPQQQSHGNGNHPHTQNQQTPGWDWRKYAQNAEARPVANGQPSGGAKAQNGTGRVYQPQPTASEPQPRQESGYSYNFNYNQGPLKSNSREKKLLNKIAPNVGKGLIVTGTICLVTAAIVGSILLMIGFASGGYYVFRWGVTGFITAMMSGAVGGLPFLIPGKIRHDRAVRCQTFYAMLKNGQNCDIREMAKAVPCSYTQACNDLRWMIHQGFYPGAYIDASRRMMVFSGYTPEPKPEPKPKKKAEEKPEPVKEEKKPGVFPEVQRIRSLNEQIADDYVSARMDRLEELTFKILSYVEANPGKEERIRQYRQHYLPTTIKILESYANFERQGVQGANIRAAMKDVESIMDTLVTGFEKQLDMLFVDEALDVSTDINVLESMMGIQGLGSDDPFELKLYGE